MPEMPVVSNGNADKGEINDFDIRTNRGRARLNWTTTSGYDITVEVLWHRKAHID